MSPNRALLGGMTLVLYSAIVSLIPSCATSSQAEVGALTALAIAIPALEVAREEAYREGLKKADAKDFPALAAAEAQRAAAMKQLVRLVQLARQYLAEDGAAKKTQKALLLSAVVDTVGDLLEAFGKGPLPAVQLPPEALRAVQLLRVVAAALLSPGPAAPQDAAPKPTQPAAGVGAP